MASVKTAISLRESLFREVETLSRRLHVSRSHIFAVAVEDFVARNKAEDLLDKINRTYVEESEEDRRCRTQMMRIHRKQAEGAW